MVAPADEAIGPRLPSGLFSGDAASRDQQQEQQAAQSASSSVERPATVGPCVDLHPTWRTKQLIGAPLSNLGNTCYMNATLQCLAHLPVLGNIVLQNRHSSNCRQAGVVPPCAACLIELQLAWQLKGRSPNSKPLFGSGVGGGTWGGAANSSVLVPRKLLNNLTMLGRTLVVGRQEDAHEFLIGVLDAVDRDARKHAAVRAATKERPTCSVVDEVFGGRVRNRVECLRCGACSDTYEPFFCISLDVAARSINNVDDALANFTEAERLDGANAYRCDRCAALCPAVKQTTIHDEPNALTLHLKRFDALAAGGKVTRHIQYAETLCLESHLSDADGANSSDMQQHQQDANKRLHGQNGCHATAAVSRRSQYVLYGVLVHSGYSMHSGHYYAYVRDSSGGWFCANDSSVYSVNRNVVFEQQAYILFYGRTAIKAPRPMPAPPTQQQHSGTNGSVSRPATPQQHGPARPVTGPAGLARGVKRPAPSDGHSPLVQTPRVYIPEAASAPAVHANGNGAAVQYGPQLPPNWKDGSSNGVSPAASRPQQHGLDAMQIQTAAAMRRQQQQQQQAAGDPSIRSPACKDPPAPLSQQPQPQQQHDSSVGPLPASDVDMFSADEGAGAEAAGHGTQCSTAAPATHIGKLAGLAGSKVVKLPPRGPLPTAAAATHAESTLPLSGTLSSLTASATAAAAAPSTAAAAPSTAAAASAPTAAPASHCAAPRHPVQEGRAVLAGQAQQQAAATSLAPTPMGGHSGVLPCGGTLSAGPPAAPNGCSAGADGCGTGPPTDAMSLAGQRHTKSCSTDPISTSSAPPRPSSPLAESAKHQQRIRPPSIGERRCDPPVASNGGDAGSASGGVSALPNGSSCFAAGEAPTAEATHAQFVEWLMHVARSTPAVLDQLRGKLQRQCLAASLTLDETLGRPDIKRWFSGLLNPALPLTDCQDRLHRLWSSRIPRTGGSKQAKRSGAWQSPGEAP